ncbi:MAG TPA: glycosyltransferase family 2 protein [Methylocella sp.]|nr:glycosyltransferase family 2 protein [Methylocella sp.]
MSISGAQGTAAKSVELSVVAPVFNESGNIDALVKRLVPVLMRSVASFEIIFIDDGSTDGTLERLRAANSADSRVRALSLSRNFGKEIAIAAGLDHATGAATVIMDADLQHPPELIETFVARWRDGYKNVFAQRIDQTIYSPLRRVLTHRFYKLFGSVGETRLPEGAGDFRLLDRQAVAALQEMREHARFSKGLYAWIGFKSIAVPFDAAPRLSGKTKFSYRRLTHLALDGLMSFSTTPLRVWTYIGLATSVLALALATIYLVRTLIFGVDVPGYASLIVSITFFSGVQLLSLGIIGEYIGRIFAEVKRRPLYLIEERVGFGAPAAENSFAKVPSG